QLAVAPAEAELRPPRDVANGRRPEPSPATVPLPSSNPHAAISPDGAWAEAGTPRRNSMSPARIRAAASGRRPPRSNESRLVGISSPQAAGLPHITWSAGNPGRRAGARQ